MDQTRGVCRTKPIADQIIEILDKRYYVEDAGIMGGRFQLHKKVAMAVLSLTSDYYFKNPEQLKPYIDD